MNTDVDFDLFKSQQRFTERSNYAFIKIRYVAYMLICLDFDFKNRKYQVYYKFNFFIND